MNRINHKFDIITDICSICGTHKRKVNHVGGGFNNTLAGTFHTEYSKDGINWQKEFINCLPKTKKHAR